MSEKLFFIGLSIVVWLATIFAVRCSEERKDREMTIIVPEAKAGEGAPHTQLCEALDAQTTKGSEWGIGTKRGVPMLVEWKYDVTPEPTYYPMPSLVRGLATHPWGRATGRCGSGHPLRVARGYAAMEVRQVSVPRGRKWHHSPQTLLLKAMVKALGPDNPLHAISTTFDREGRRSVIVWVGKAMTYYRLPEAVNEWIVRNQTRTPESDPVPSITFEICVPT